MQIDVYHIVCEHNWGDQPMATTFDREAAEAYVADKADHRVEIEWMDEDLAFQIADRTVY